MPERLDHHCANCSVRLQGEYCAVCGQKRFRESDRRFGNLLREFFEAATDLDGRFWGSLRALLFHPGKLSRDYLHGRRTRWMSPVALFLLVNLVYFFFAPQSDFTVPFEWEVPGRIALASQDASALSEDEIERLRDEPGPFYADLFGELVERRVQEGGITYRELREAYNAKVPEVSKALAVLHVPFLALALMLMFLPARRYYAEHFVVALHLVAFYMATILVFGYGLDFVHLFAPSAEWHYTALNWLIRVVLTVYIVTALRRAYARNWPWSAAGMLGLFLAYVAVNFFLYRPILFLTVLASL